MVTLEKIYQAAHALKGVIRETDLIRTTGIAKDCNLWLKPENLQITGSFKVRGAYFKMSGLSQDEAAKGVVACSAGNHAQGVALAAQKRGIAATIFLPAAAPISKMEATRRYGAELKLIDGVYDDAYNASQEYQKETGAVFVHPFDDPDVIAGQGTIALEVLDQLPDVDAVIVPIGGGGLISGIAYAIKKLKPSCKVYGVQAQGAGSMLQALELQERKALAKVSTFADGIAVKSPGELTFALCNEYVDAVATVSDDEIAAAILTLMEQQKLVAEGAGAVAVAAAMTGKFPLEGKNVCAVLSGGNIDVNILSKVISRGLLTSGRRADLTIPLTDKPGQLESVARTIAKVGANVTKVRHDQGGENTDINECILQVSIETKNMEHLNQVKDALHEEGYNLR